MQEDMTITSANIDEEGSVLSKGLFEDSEDNFQPEETHEVYDDSNDNLKETEPAQERRDDFKGWSDLASYMRDEGIFTGEIGEINTIDDFNDLVQNQIDSGINSRYRNIEAALQSGVPGSEINKFEQTLGFLNGITEAQLESESDASMDLRKNIIYQDYVDRGFSHERAIKMVESSVSQGMDIQDAKEALEALKQNYSYNYNNLIEASRQREYERQMEIQNQTAMLQNKLENEENLFGSIKVTKNMRQNAFSYLTQPIDQYGQTYIQKHMAEDPSDFWSKIGLIYAATDGLTKMDKVFNDEVKRASNKRVSDIESSFFRNDNNSGSYSLY